MQTIQVGNLLAGEQIQQLTTLRQLMMAQIGPPASTNQYVKCESERIWCGALG